ncbi:hypothetical protein Prudu_106S000200, partial [Prunus dulcis]
MAIGHRGPHRSRVDRSAGFPVNRVSDLPKSVPVSEKANVGIGVIQDEMHAPEVRLISRRDPREVQLARTSCGRLWVWSNYRGDSAEFSAEVGREFN